ncbi:MAG: hypothetical protein MUC28_03875 [Planctomycetes bacterium]|jgi:hypothetical protein|nr:hypothetical protein [Planctomycetota bacterium]
MMKKITLPLFFVFLFALAAMPLVPAGAWSNENYIYVKTETGTQERYVHRNVHEVVDPRTRFNTNDSVLVLTQIRDISGINTFRIRYDLRGLNNSRSQTVYANVFSPNYQNWPETISSWNYFDRLPDGQYEYKVLISINDGGYRLLDTKRFEVGRGGSNYEPCYNCGHDYYDDDRDYDHRYDYDYYGRYNYTYGWTHMGTNVRSTGNNQYEVVSSKLDFNTDEDVYALTKITNIYGIDRFRVRHEVYANGNQYYRRQDAAEQRPDKDNWSYNFSYSNLGKLPEGYHEIRIFISVNGGSYTLLDKKNISVNRARNAYYDNRYDYRYNWTQADINVRHVRGYIYDVDNPKATFTTDENVVALTKLSDIKNIEYFQIKHELIKSGSVIRTSESPIRRPNRNYWEYNYFDTDFGRLSPGSYQVKVYVRINGGSYKYLDTKNISVEDRYYQHTNYYDTDYNYDWTHTGTKVIYGSSSGYQPYYPQPYPYYYNSVAPYYN